jgi:hypothetical protein
VGGGEMHDDLRRESLARPRSGPLVARVSRLALLLALRPSKLSGRDAKHLTEMTCQMALVRKAHGICYL